MLTLGLKMMGTNNIVYQLTIWILHGQLIILFINSTDCNNLNTFFTLCLPGSRLNDEMLLLFFHLYTSERDPQDPAETSDRVTLIIVVIRGAIHISKKNTKTPPPPPPASMTWSCGSR